MDKVPFTIRPGGPDDAAAIHDLVTALAIYEREPDAVEATVEDFRRGFGDDGQGAAFEVLIAEVGDDAVGFALFFPVFSTWTGKRSLYLEDLFVRPEMRGHGVGKALFAALAKRAVERGWERYEWQVLDWNEPAIDFYESQGAQARRDWIPFRMSGDALARLADESSEA